MFDVLCIDTWQGISDAGLIDSFIAAFIPSRANPELHVKPEFFMMGRIRLLGPAWAHAHQELWDRSRHALTNLCFLAPRQATGTCPRSVLQKDIRVSK